MDQDKQHQIKFRASGTEKARIEAFAKDQGYQLGEYLKNAALELVPDPEVPDDPVPTPDEAAALHQRLEAEAIGAEDAPEADLEKRETYVRFLYERNTELHRDKQKRWPGSRARVQSASEWPKVKAGEPLERIPQREDKAPINPTTYRLADERA